MEQHKTHIDFLSFECWSLLTTFNVNVDLEPPRIYISTMNREDMSQDPTMDSLSASKLLQQKIPKPKLRSHPGNES